MSLRSLCFAGLILGHAAVAQDASSLWLRYALRIPVGERWTWHNEPDFRMGLSPVSLGFKQFLFRSDLQLKANAVHVFALGMVGVATNLNSGASTAEWRPQATWYLHPTWNRDLLLRARVEWREQSVRNAERTQGTQVSTVRCRAMAQYEFPLERGHDNMLKGFRAQTEILLRAYSSVGLQPFDQFRISAAYVSHLGKSLEWEGAWTWFFRDPGIVQQWLRLGLTHRLKRKPSSTD